MVTMSRDTHRYHQVNDGDVVELPLDRVYHQQCCNPDCGLVHDLHTSIDDAGRVFLTVFRNNAETARLRALDGIEPLPQQTSSRRRRRREYAPIDDTKHTFEILGDAPSTPIFMNDGKASTMRTMTMDDERRRVEEENRRQLGPDGIIKDGGRYRVPLFLKDAAPIITTTATLSRQERRAARQAAAALDAVKTVTVVTAEDARRVTEAKIATEKMIARDAEDYLNSHRPGWRGSTDAVNFTASDAAYNERKLADSEAWRRQDAAYRPDLQTGAPTRALASTPPVGAYAQAGFDAKAGDPCAFEGSPVGKLVERDGWLFCEISGTSGDAVFTGDRAAQDQAWHELQQRTQDAWRS
jgi:hypothetical protein